MRLKIGTPRKVPIRGGGSCHKLTRFPTRFRTDAHELI
jgi:hypothetical protein